MATLGPGEFFGEMALVDDGPRSASIFADSELTTLVISKWEFRPLVKSHPELAWKLIEHLVVRLREEQTGRDARLLVDVRFGLDREVSILPPPWTVFR